MQIWEAREAIEELWDCESIALSLKPQASRVKDKRVVINLSGICEVRFLPISDTSALGKNLSLIFPFHLFLDCL